MPLSLKRIQILEKKKKRSLSKFAVKEIDSAPHPSSTDQNGHKIQVNIQLNFPCTDHYQASAWKVSQSLGTVCRMGGQHRHKNKTVGSWNFGHEGQVATECKDRKWQVLISASNSVTDISHVRDRLASGVCCFWFRSCWHHRRMLWTWSTQTARPPFILLADSAVESALKSFWQQLVSHAINHRVLDLVMRRESPCVTMVAVNTPFFTGSETSALLQFARGVESILLLCKCCL